MKNHRKPEKHSAEYKAHMREIKAVLCGKLTLREDKRLAVSDNWFGNRWGFEDGAPETFLFGVTRKEYVYDAPEREYARARYNMCKLVESIGKALYLETAPQNAACLMKHIFFRPVVLEFGERTAEDDTRELVLYGYCGRTLVARLALRHAVKRFEKDLPKRVYRRGKPERKEEKNGKTEHQGKNRKS